MRSVLVVAADEEWNLAASLYPGLDNVRPGSVADLAGNGTRWILRAGWGKVASAIAVQRAILAPGLILLVGTCGGVPGCIDRESIVVVHRAVTHDVRPLMGAVDAEIEHYTSECDSRLVAEACDFFGCGAVTIATGDRDLTPSEAVEVHQRFGAPVIDWESAAIAYAARRSSIPWCVIKGVSDMIVTPGDAYGMYDEYTDGTRRVLAPILARVGELAERLAAAVTTVTK